MTIAQLIPGDWRVALLITGAIALAAAGCENGTGPSPRLRIVAGGSAQDTVNSQLDTPLVVQYLDARGQPAAGVIVRLDCVTFGPNGPRVLLQREGDVFRIEVIDTTDQDGRVTVLVALGPSAGVGWVRATVPAMDLADSTSFVGLPGALAAVDVAPNDTALYAADTLSLRGRAFDQWGNERGEILEWSASADVVEISAPARVRGVRIGRAVVRARVRTFVDSVSVNVVPPGVIAAMFSPIAVGEPPYVVVFNTDGTGLTRIEIGADCAHGIQWTPSGDRLAFGRNGAPGICFTQRLYLSTLAGAVQRVRSDTTPLAGEFWPAVTADGQWLYFSGRPDHQNGEIWRVRLNGDDAERIGPPANSYDLDQQPSPSPTGAEVVYTSLRSPESEFMLRILDVNTRAVRDLGIRGASPSWSPNGDLIVFERDGGYHVVGTDGTNEHPLVDTSYAGGRPDPATWSPDGRWVVVVVRDPAAYAPVFGRLALVEVETGLVLPLGWTPQLTYPAWRP